MGEVKFRLELWHQLSRRDAYTDEAISRFLSTNSYCRFGHQLHVSFHNFCVAGEFREAGVTSVVRRSLSSASSMALITGGSEIGQSVQWIMSK